MFSSPSLQSAGARVAIDVGCALTEVASHRTSVDLPSGPMDVEVALAWRAMQWHANDDPMLHSFFERSRDHGTHLDGLIDGIEAFFGADRREQLVAGVVAAVAVVLADVKWGNPTRDRLVSPEARAPVAVATEIALARWAEAHPEAAAALRNHKLR